MGNHVYQGSAHFFCNGANNKYFRLCGPWGLHYNCSVLLWELKAAIDNMQINKHSCIPIKLFTATGERLDDGPDLACRLCFPTCFLDKGNITGNRAGLFIPYFQYRIVEGISSGEDDESSSGCAEF